MTSLRDSQPGSISVDLWKAAGKREFLSNRNNLFRYSDQESKEILLSKNKI